MIYWKVSHKYKLLDHIERKDIGIYSSLDNAEKAIASLKDKNGFKDTIDGFRIRTARYTLHLQSVARFSYPQKNENQVIFSALRLKVICKELALYFDIKSKLYYICLNFSQRENITLR